MIQDMTKHVELYHVNNLILNLNTIQYKYVVA